jgi:hypothetical protein
MPIPPVYAKVDLDRIVRAYHNPELDISGEVGKKTLVDNLNGFVASRSVTSSLGMRIVMRTMTLMWHQVQIKILPCLG